MVEDQITDGRRIAELLSSEVDGRTDDELEYCSVRNPNPDVEPTVGGARAYDITITTTDGDEQLTTAFVHSDRVHLEFDDGHERAIETAERLGLRVRPKASKPPKTVVFVESGGQVKRATTVVQAVFRSLENNNAT